MTPPLPIQNALEGILEMFLVDSERYTLNPIGGGQQLLQKQTEK